MAYLKDLYDMYPFNISGVDGGNKIEELKLGLDVTTVITWKFYLC